MAVVVILKETKKNCTQTDAPEAYRFFRNIGD